jgi:hypothetical protein
MSINGLVISIALTLVVLAYVLLPVIWRHRRTESEFISKQRERALAYYERVLKNVRDLDDDYTTGKIDEAEYQTERDVWMNRGVHLLKMLDELDEEHNIVADTSADDADIDEAIEVAIRQARETQLQGAS